MTHDIDIERIVIDEEVADSSLTTTVLKNASPVVPRDYISNVDDFIRGFSTEHIQDDGISHGKKTLLLTKNKGAFFKACPGTRRYLCCLYKILNFATGCPLDCSYCILQGYFSNPLLTVFSNSDDMMRELENVFDAWQSNVLRIGTGEFTDSLALDHLTGFNALIIPFLRQWNKVFFEIKSKTTNISELEPFKQDPHIITSWSLSPQSIIDAEEYRTAPLVERLSAARQCEEWGFGLGFHFDPIIHYPGWEDEYHDLIVRLFRTIDWRRVYWISMGTFRFPPHLKEVIERRFPASRILVEESIIGGDGKVRYFLPIRLKIYKTLYRWLRAYAPDVPVYFCMESSLVWKEVMGWSPHSNRDLGHMLDESCRFQGKIS